MPHPYKGKPSKIRVHKSPIELIVDHIDIPRKTLRVIWACSAVTVQSKLRNPSKLTFGDLDALATLLNTPLVTLIWLISQSDHNQSFESWMNEQFERFVVSYELFLSKKVTFTILFNGKEIDLRAMYLSIHGKYLERIKQDIKSGEIERNVNRYNLLDKEPANYLKTCDSQLIYKPTQQDSNSFPSPPEVA